MKKNLITAIKLLFFLALGILLVWLSIKDLTEEERKAIIISFKKADYRWVILSIVLGVISHLIRAVRWRRLLKPMGYNPSIKNTFFAVLIGYFANYAIPRLGEITRCGILNRYEKIPINKSLGTVITERALDMLIFFILFFITVLTQYERLNNYLQTEIYDQLSEKFSFFSLDHFVGFTLLGILGLIIILFLIFKKKLETSKLYIKTKEISIGFLHGLKSLFKIKNPLLFILESIAIWTLYFFMVYVCFFCFPQTSSLGIEAGLAVLVIGSIGIMITPGGIGLYPIIVQKTLALYFITKATSLALGWISWTAQTLMIIVAGSISLILLSFQKRKNDTIRNSKIKNSR